MVEFSKCKMGRYGVVGSSLSVFARTTVFWAHASLEQCSRPALVIGHAECAALKGGFVGQEDHSPEKYRAIVPTVAFTIRSVLNTSIVLVPQSDSSPR